MRKSILYYLLVVGIFVALIMWYLDAGSVLEVGKILNTIPTLPEKSSAWDAFISEIIHAFKHPLAMLLLQIVVIITTSRIFSYVIRKIGQPMVIGEIIAGIFLGPSILGLFFPETVSFLFAKESLPAIQLLSQMGLVLFMFIIGMELDLSVLKKKAQAALTISHATIVLPYFMGVVLAYYIYGKYAGESVHFHVFALFMGISMSITAFPVLARIVQERGLNRTAFGSFIITIAAIDDITAWCILAGVIAIAKAGNATSALFVIGITLIYAAIMWWGVRPLLRKMSEIYVSKENLNKTVVAVIFLMLLLSAYITEMIGIHALFGAFFAGVIMPQNSRFKEIFTEKIEDVSSVLLLPLFFAFTGLRTQIGLINTAEAWGVCAVVISVAVLGKFVGGSFSARFLGLSWKHSLMIGTLMNTRGLMELIVLNIGYDLGILSPQIFAIMVLMALTTTFMTGPMLNSIDYLFHPARKRNRKKSTFNVLLSFGPPEMGSTLLEVAYALVKTDRNLTQIAALHLTPSTEIGLQEAEVFERNAFQHINASAEKLNVSVSTIYKSSEKIATEIAKTTQEAQTDFLFMGSARSVFHGNVTGGIIQEVLQNVRCRVGILWGKDIQKIQKVLVILQDKTALYLSEILQVMCQNPALMIEVADFSEKFPFNDFADKHIVERPITHLVHKEMVANYDLIIVDILFWENVLAIEESWTDFLPSVLIVRA